MAAIIPGWRRKQPPTEYRNPRLHSPTGESRNCFRDRLKAHDSTGGVWRRYVRAREELKYRGVSPEEAHSRIALDFGPDVYPWPKGMVPLYWIRRKDKARRAAIGEVAACISAIAGGYRPPESWRDQVQREREVQQAKEREGMADTVSEDKNSPPVSQRRFVPKARFKGRTCTTAEAADWAFENMMVSDVTADDAPGPTAWTMLKWARSSKANMTAFMRTMLARIPKTDVKEAGGLTDDGRDLDDRLQAIKERFGDGEKGE